MAGPRGKFANEETGLILGDKNARPSDADTGHQCLFCRISCGMK